MIKLLLADDHQVFREGILSFFEENNEMEVIAQAANGLEVIEKVKFEQPDVLVMDISMPEQNGIETARLLKESHPTIKIIMLSMHDNHPVIREILELGVDGYLLKTTSKSELLEAIKTVMMGKRYFGQDVQEVFMNSFGADNMEAPVQLTRREKEILELICEELNTNEIAEKLFVSKHTVETHRKNLLAKTGAKNVAGLVKFALSNKLI
jgi:DNA-binding NarL/FixJ family response regulator